MINDSRISFGDSKNYYSKLPPAQTRDESRSEKLLSASILYSQPELKQQVKRALKRWNPQIRETLRNETGLKFSGNNIGENVSVKVVDGYPLPFREIIQRYDHPELWKLIVNRNLLETTKAGIKLIEDQYEEIKNVIQSTPTRNEIGNIKSFLDKLLKVIQVKELDEQILKTRMDILGSYFFRVPVIFLYWQVIGFFSLRYGISSDALTAVVLTHELAHAYTHIGKDIDKKDWNTEAFAQTDLYVVEGLAQFYTEIVSEKLMDRYPQVNEAYEKLLQRQSGPYLEHKQWLQNKNRIGEVIRLALLQIRTSEETTIEEFNKLLPKIRNEIFASKRRQSDLFGE